MTATPQPPAPSSVRRPASMNRYTCAHCGHVPLANLMKLHCGNCDWWTCPKCKWLNGKPGAIRGGAS